MSKPIRYALFCCALLIGQFLIGNLVANPGVAGRSLSTLSPFGLLAMPLGLGLMVWWERRTSELDLASLRRLGLRVILITSVLFGAFSFVFALGRFWGGAAFSFALFSFLAALLATIFTGGLGALVWLYVPPVRFAR